MKPRTRIQFTATRWAGAVALGACLAVGMARAAETNAPAAGTNAAAAVAATNAPAAETKPAAAGTNAPAAAEAAPALTPEQMFEGGAKTYNNWVELSAGGFITSGNEAQFQERHRTWGGPFGGIEDLHYQGNIDKKTTFTIDGRGLFDQDDYKLRLGVAREKLGYLRFSYSQFRTWYNGDGGFYPPSGAYYPLSDDALGLDRGELVFEGGLTLDKWPVITFKYSHRFRDGEKSSTEWGATHPVGLALTRNLSPSFYDLNEKSDSFQLDATHRIKATSFGLGLRYDTGKLDDALKITQSPGEPLQQKVTSAQGTSYDMFNVHGFAETTLKKNLVLSAGASYSDLDNDFSGSRIYGSDFDVSYVPSIQNGFGYFDLNGGSRLHEYIADVNLMSRPTAHLTIIPSVRIEKDDTDASVTGFESLGANPVASFNANSDYGLLDVRERLDVRYNGITNWVLYARGELTEGDGNLKETGGLVPINGIGVQPIQRETEDDRFFQKYSAGARWYPAKSVTLDVGGYYKRDAFDYEHQVDSTPNDSFNRYPAYLVIHNFDTYDGNAELTLRPRANVTLVTRYEYQLSTIHTAPDSISGLSELESSKMTSHILAQNISWSPWARLYLQLAFNYVLSETHTPASDFTQAILNAQNNYWTLNFNTGFVVDDRTDFKVGYFYYRADDYKDNSEFGLPLGSGAQEHGVTAALVRRLTERIRLTLKYGYYDYTDEAFGNNRDYRSHMIYSSLQYRF